MKPFRFVLIIALLSGLLNACQAAQPGTTAQSKPLVFVSILPQQYFVQRIAGDTVQIEVMVGPGAEPHTYEPKPAQMSALAQANLYFSIGDAFETTWLGRLQDINPNLKVVDTAAGITKRKMEAHDGSAEEHTEDTNTEAGELDPHIWLSPPLVAVQAQTIHDALVTLNPDQKALYDANLQAFQADISALDASLKAELSNLSTHSFMVYHPSWGYFADAYGLTQIPIEIGGTEPSPSELAAIIDEAKAQNIHVIFAQPEFSNRSAETIAAEIQGKVVMIDPLAENWLENLQTVGQALAQGLK